jgi:signal transduction histidine kinase
MRGKVFRARTASAAHAGREPRHHERRRTEERCAPPTAQGRVPGTLAHELRNPLAPIRNAVEILKVEGSSPPTCAGQGVLDRQVQVMSRLLDDLLDVVPHLAQPAGPAQGARRAQACARRRAGDEPSGDRGRGHKLSL